MNIIVTGKVGTGKTTVCEKVVAIAKRLGYTCGGILTPKSKEDIIIVDVQTGERKVLASINNIYQGPRVGKYYFNPEGINFGVNAIDKGASASILIVDEIGHLELSGEGFAKILELIKVGRVKNCILVIRSELLPGFLLNFPTKPLIFEATANNRNQLPQEIGSVLFENHQGGMTKTRK